MMRYPVIVETGPEGGYSAYPPDVPGRVAAARTRDEVERLIEEPLKVHLADMMDRPLPSAVVLLEV